MNLNSNIIPNIYLLSIDKQLAIKIATKIPPPIRSYTKETKLRYATGHAKKKDWTTKNNKRKKNCGSFINRVRFFFCENVYKEKKKNEL